MTPNGEGRHYIADKKLHALLRGITSKHNGNEYCVNCRHSFKTKKQLVKLCERKEEFCNALMSSDDTKILEFN